MKHIDKVKFLQKQLKDIKDLEIPTIPSIYYQVEDLINSGEATVHNLETIIHTDPALTAKILMLVNSAAYGMRQEITTLQRAINIIGFVELSNLVLSSSIIKMFKPSDGVHFSVAKFWEHSIATGVASRVIARELKAKYKVNPQEAFTAGLLHDIGKLIEKEFFPAQFIKALSHCKSFKTTLYQAEEHLFGFDHQHVGHALAREWRLPSIYHTAIGYHHQPDALDEKNRDFAMVSIIHLANIFAKTLMLGSGGDPFIPQAHELSLKHLDIGASDLDHILSTIELEAQEAIAILTQ